jgi:HemY protein
VPVCAGCASFDTLAWKRPPESEMVTSSAAQMLPLIVGQAKPDAVEPSLALVEDAEEVSAPSEGASEASTSEEPRRAAS